jgi:DNA-3-methyladenine glycosylase II
MERIQHKQHFETLYDWSIQIEHKLQPVIDRFGYPPFWHRDPDFATLVLTIFEQKVSLASAKAAVVKLKEKIGEITPENILNLSDEELWQCNFSRQKALYTRILANEIVSGNLNLNVLIMQTDEKSSQL